jgi:NADH dehydrogenase
MLWLTVHLLQLVSLRNRALVLVNWTWNYFRYDRANRLVTDDDDVAFEPERAEREHEPTIAHR